jgi:hypothetical protein
LYERRLEDLSATMPLCEDDQVTSATISGLTALSRNGHDTVHQLMIDMHGELNTLLAAVSAETIDGASTYGLTDGDRVLVRAFMRGVNETAGLKFDHPGLATTAAHDGTRLSIQNDLGSTESHIIVIHVEGLAATVTYTDVHHARVRFLQQMLQPHGVTWAAAPRAAGAAYELSVGRYSAETSVHLERYLQYLGSRLVFLIDWNRARKRLARLVSKSEAAALLKWAAESNLGHRAFLQAGDVRLVETAFARAMPLQARFGVRLDEMLGRESARLFLMAVLRAASSGLSAGQSLYLIQDKVEAELLRYVETPERHALSGAAEQAMLIAALADHVRHEFVRRAMGEAGDEAVRTRDLARRWMVRADEMQRQEDRAVECAGDPHHLRPLLSEAGAAARALEEAAFMLPLIPAAIDVKTLSLLESLAELVGTTAREYVRGLEEGRGLLPTSDHADVDGFLVTIDHLVDCGRQASLSRRAITERLVRGSGDWHELYVVTTMAQGFERAAVRLARCGSIVRDQVLHTRLRQ